MAAESANRESTLGGLAARANEMAARGRGLRVDAAEAEKSETGGSGRGGRPCPQPRCRVGESLCPPKPRQPQSLGSLKREVDAWVVCKLSSGASEQGRACPPAPHALMAPLPLRERQLPALGRPRETRFVENTRGTEGSQVLTALLKRQQK